MHAERIQTTLAAPKGGSPRAEGVHVSSLIRGLAIQTGRLKVQEDRLEELGLVEVSGSHERWWQRLDSISQLRIAIGLAWEDWYLGQLSDTIAGHPGEMEVDGIYMNHDGESLDLVATPRGPSQILALDEVKATYKSVKTVGDLRTQFIWTMQTKAYCHALSTTRAYLHILYLCGDYSFPISPQLHVWRIDYTPHELQETWDLLTQYRDYRLQAAQYGTSD